MHPLISVAPLCSWLHTHSRALGLLNRQYVAINQRDGLQPSCTGIVPSNGQGTEIHVFKESRNQFLVIELIKKWLIETAGRVGNGTSQSLAEDWRLSIHQYQPLAGETFVINTGGDMLLLAWCTESNYYFYKLLGRGFLIFF